MKRGGERGSDSDGDEEDERGEIGRALGLVECQRRRGRAALPNSPQGFLPIFLAALTGLEALGLNQGEKSSQLTLAIPIGSTIPPRTGVEWPERFRDVYLVSPLARCGGIADGQRQ